MALLMVEVLGEYQWAKDVFFLRAAGVFSYVVGDYLLSDEPLTYYIFFFALSCSYTTLLKAMGPLSQVLFYISDYHPIHLFPSYPPSIHLIRRNLSW